MPRQNNVRRCRRFPTLFLNPPPLNPPNPAAGNEHAGVDEPGSIRLNLSSYTLLCQSFFKMVFDGDVLGVQDPARVDGGITGPSHWKKARRRDGRRREVVGSGLAGEGGWIVPSLNGFYLPIIPQ